ncbi:anti-sigma regulatory factor [Emticicia sp. BO119]|uniref:anti-sigma regulatory factor n=1 Tax=Emticicia sp. BO119 TaxID=2757768 RepID=UPI0015F0F3B8|nr:anti-sigma regulatory factor [Emticicia sp. BO119]MBA4853823.1 anti-sigma regulatory factor [Emticicia sp. BO119]
MIVILNKDAVSITREQDTILLRNRVKEWATKIGMGLVNQTKLITAASELVRNMLKYARGGVVNIEIVSKGRENGVRLIFIDKGPGIHDINLAMRDGYTTGRSLGLGLPGARRLVNEFEIQSVVNEGTTISITKWKNG